MATQQFNAVSISPSRVPTSGYMTIGISSGGTNQNATVVMPPLKVNGTINAVKVVVQWDNDAANEGFRATATHTVVGASNCSGSWNYYVSGASGTAYVPIGSWSTTSNWSFVLRSISTVKSTSKGYLRKVTVVVEYTTPPPTPVITYINEFNWKTGGKWYPARKSVKVKFGSWRNVVACKIKVNGVWRSVF